MRTDIKQLLAHYRLGSVRSIEPLRAGHVADKYLVEADGSRYVLRVRPVTFSVASVESDHDFERFLHSEGVPVPRPIQAEDGATVHLADGGPWELLEYLPAEMTLEEAGFSSMSVELGEFLGRFHRVSVSYPRRVQAKPGFVGPIPIAVKAKYFEAPLQGGVPHWRKGVTAAGACELAWLANELDELRQKTLPLLDDTPQLVCHNDFFGPNLLVAADHISGLVDFDFCLTTSHLVDVVEGLHGAVLDSEGDDVYYWLRDDGQLDLEGGRAFLQTYSDHSGLPVSAAAVEKMLRAKLVSLVLYPGHLPKRPAKLSGELFRRTRLALQFLGENRGWTAL